MIKKGYGRQIAGRGRKGQRTAQAFAGQVYFYLATAHLLRCSPASSQHFVNFYRLSAADRSWSPDQKYLFTTNGNSNDISVIDVAAEEVVKSVPVGQQPWGVVVAPD